MDSSRDSIGLSSSWSDCAADPVALLNRKVKQSRKVFIGTYLERRYVQSLGAYRDIVAIDRGEEELFALLEEIMRTLEQRRYGDKWLGITCTTKDSVVQYYNLWVELDGITLGRHWFQLKSIKVQGRAIQMQLKFIKMFQTNERRSLDTVEYPPINYREILTYENTCLTLRFAAVCVMSILTLTCNVLWYLGDYSLKLTHELSEVIRAMTPIFFSIMDFFRCCVGGVLWLFYTMWRGEPRGGGGRAYPMKPPALEYNRRSAGVASNFDKRYVRFDKSY